MSSPTQSFPTQSFYFLWKSIEKVSLCLSALEASPIDTPTKSNGINIIIIVTIIIHHLDTTAATQMCIFTSTDDTTTSSIPATLHEPAQQRVGVRSMPIATPSSTPTTTATYTTAHTTTHTRTTPTAANSTLTEDMLLRLAHSLPTAANTTHTASTIAAAAGSTVATHATHQQVRG